MDTLFIWFWSCRDNRLRRHDGFERVNDWNLFHVSCRCPFWPRSRDQLTWSCCSSDLLHQGIGSWFAYILPSALVINLSLTTSFTLLTNFSLVMSVVRAILSEKGLLVQTFSRVLMLRRKASPTEITLHDQYSHMINEALEMMESHRGETSDDFLPDSSPDAHAQL